MKRILKVVVFVLVLVACCGGTYWALKGREVSHFNGHYKLSYVIDDKSGEKVLDSKEVLDQLDKDGVTYDLSISLNRKIGKYAAQINIHSDFTNVNSDVTDNKLRNFLPAKGDVSIKFDCQLKKSNDKYEIDIVNNIDANITAVFGRGDNINNTTINIDRIIDVNSDEFKKINDLTKYISVENKDGTDYLVGHFGNDEGEYSIYFEKVS